jgi:hypothetical protein
MVKRRTLVAGIKGDRKREQEFVYGKKESVRQAAKGRPAAKPEPETTPQPSPEPAEQPTSPPAGRSPLTTRLRSDLADALKRASLERQLAKQTPNTVQDILEAALEPWLRDNGYLK